MTYMKLNEDFFDDIEQEDIVSDTIDDIKKTDNVYNTRFCFSYYPMEDLQECDLEYFADYGAPVIHKKIQNLLKAVRGIGDFEEPEYYTWYDITDAVQEINGYTIHYKENKEYLHSLYVSVRCNTNFKNVKQILKFITYCYGLSIPKCSLLGISIVENGKESQFRNNTVKSSDVIGKSRWNSGKTHEALYNFIKLLLPSDRKYIYQELKDEMGNCDDAEYYVTMKEIGSTYGTNTKYKMKVMSTAKMKVDSKFLDSFNYDEYCKFGIFNIVQPQHKANPTYTQDAIKFLRTYCDKYNPTVSVCVMSDMVRGRIVFTTYYYFSHTEYVDNEECDFVIEYEIEDNAVIGAYMKPDILANFLTPLAYLKAYNKTIINKIQKFANHKLQEQTLEDINDIIKQNISKIKK